jgi:glycolate oxidase FAD binding subunit
MSRSGASPRSLAAALEKLLGQEALVPSDALPSWTVGGAMPLAAALPATVEEVQALLALAAAEGVGVVPLGGRTDPGSEAPSGPFLVLGTQRLGGVQDYEPADLTVTAGAGITLGALGATLAERGQWLPVDPPFAPGRTLGGLVATGAAGPLGTAYGAPRDHVLGLTAVTADARVLRLGGRVMKNVAGFDLVKLMVGSRGTLGVVVSASVRVFPRPEEDRVMTCSASHAGELLSLARSVATGPVVPASAVLMSRGEGTGGGATLAVRLQGASVSVSADQARLLPGGSVFRQVPPGEVEALLERVRDHAAAHPVVVRASALPVHLADVLDAVGSALPQGETAADVMVGRVRCGVSDPGSVGSAALGKLRVRVEAMGGSVTLERAPKALLDGVSAYGPGGRAGALGVALRRRFDPGGVLSPGRFVR